MFILFWWAGGRGKMYVCMLANLFPLLLGQADTDTVMTSFQDRYISKRVPCHSLKDKGLTFYDCFTITQLRPNNAQQSAARP